MSKIKVSIVIPTFRRPTVLRETLQALSKLDFPREEYEVIAVDDGSNDETEQIVDTMKSNFLNLFYYAQKNSGVAMARNYGAKQATSEI